MNKAMLMGRLTRDPEVRYSKDASAVARYTLAVNRRISEKDGSRQADFINCVAFSKNAEFVEKYLKKGMQIIITGRIQTGSYTNKEEKKIYTTDVIVEEHEFTESKGSSQESPQSGDGFMNIPEGVDEELPFN